MAYRDLIVPIAGFILLGFSIYVFLWALQLMIYRDVPSSLLAALIGFASMSGGVTLIRVWGLSRSLDKVEKEGSARGSS